MRIRVGTVWWMIWVVCAGALHLFGNNYGTLVIFVMSAVIPPMFAVIMRFTAYRINMELELPCEALKTQTINAVLTIKNHGRQSISQANCLMICENLFTRERSEHRIWFKIMGNGVERVEFELSAVHCGKLRVSASDFQIYDPFGLFSRRTNAIAEGGILILPEIFDVQITLSDLSNVSDGGTEYSDTSPGFDSSETFAIREYMPGDPIKSVHWKISQKTDNLMVREFGMPITNQMLLSFIPPLSSREYADISAMAEVFISVSSSLAEIGFSHDICWVNYQSKKFERREICGRDDVDSVMSELLSNPPDGNAITNYDIYKSYGRITVVTSTLPDIDYLNNGGKTTILLCTGKDAFIGGIQSNGMYVYPFSCGAYRNELSLLEL